MVKVGHTNVNESLKKALLKSWVIDCFEEALDPDKDPMERCFDDYKWVFDLEIEFQQLGGNFQDRLDLYVLWKPSRDFTHPLRPPSGLKGLLQMLNATVIPTKVS
ncbi:hypothetical protein Tco_1578010 [Tanacetum coccineum]